jgi:hypothetical protein
MNHGVGRWICWGVSGLIFAVDTTCVIVDAAHADHPIHGVARTIALACFVLGVGFWAVEADAARLTRPLSATEPPPPADPVTADPVADGRYLADMAESVRLGREIQRRQQNPPEAA